MKDYMGNELTIGDKVVYIRHSKTSSRLSHGTIERLTDYFVVVENGHRVKLEKTVKVEGK